MPLMIWGPMLAVGVKEIDDQHQKLVQMANELNDAMRDGQGREALGKILKELVRYTSYHFATEERLMDQHKYAQSAEHKKQHKDLVHTVTELVAKFEKGDAALSTEVMNFLREWLMKHILNTDKAFAKDLASKGVK